jgi:hypothetical protein
MRSGLDDLEADMRDGRGQALGVEGRKVAD